MPDLCDCSWPLGLAEVLSRHRTSEGEVRYLRCPCGRMHLVLAGSVLNTCERRQPEICC